MTTLAVRAQGLGKRFGDRDALVALDLEIPVGGCFGLFGHNGSGKTTFLKLVSGLLKPTRGTLEVLGFRIPKQAERARRQLGVLLDHHLLPPDFPLGEGLRYLADLYGLENPGPRIVDLLDRVGLSWRRRDPLRTFSRGMGQRASLACALLPDPDLIILDEPFTGLDPKGCDLVSEVVREHVNRGKTALLVTHELARGLDLADEVVVLDRGQEARRGPATSITVENLREVMG